MTILFIVVIIIVRYELPDVPGMDFALLKGGIVQDLQIQGDRGLDRL
jgi:hypothetical protein